MKVSDEAFARIQKLLTTSEKNIPGTAGLRVFVKGGGCGGLQYEFAIAVAPEEDDTVIEKDGGRLFIDSMSYAYLGNATLNYISNVTGEIFTVDNPDVKSTCGCGSSFTM